MSYLTDMAEELGISKKKPGEMGAGSFGPAAMSIRNLDIQSIKARVAAERGGVSPTLQTPSRPPSQGVVPAAQPGPSISQKRGPVGEFFHDVGQTARAVGTGLYSAVADVLPGQVAKTIVGGDVALGEGGGAQRYAEKQAEDLKRWEMSLVDRENKLFGIVKAGTVQQGLQQIGNSIAPMAAGFGAGATAASMVDTPFSPVADIVGGVVGAGTLTAPMAYRASKTDYVMQMRDSFKAAKPDATEAEWTEFRSAIEKDAQLYGLWEAGPEVVGNMVTAGLIKIPAGSLVKAIPLIRNGAARVLASGAAKLTLDLPVEVATETVTGYKQATIEYKSGLRENPPTLAGSFQENAPQTIVMTLATMGLGSVANSIMSENSGPAQRHKIIRYLDKGGVDKKVIGSLLDAKDWEQFNQAMKENDVGIRSVGVDPAKATAGTPASQAPTGSPVLTDEQLAGIVPKPAEDAINAPPPEPKTISIINQRAAPEVQSTVDDALSKRKIAPGTFTAVQTPANPVAQSMDKAGSALGHRVIWVEGGESLPKIIRGASTTNARDTFIIVNTRMLGESADQIAPTVVVHELTHRVKAMDADGYGKIDGAVFSRPEAQAEFDAYRQSKPSLDEAVAREEYVAEQVQKYGSDERFWTDIFKGMEPTRVEAIVSAIREIAQKVRAALGMGDQPDAVYQAAVLAFQKMRVDGGVEAAKVEAPPVAPIETPPVVMQAPLTVAGEAIPPNAPISVQPQPVKGAANGLQKGQEEKVAAAIGSTRPATISAAGKDNEVQTGQPVMTTVQPGAPRSRGVGGTISATPAARQTKTQAAPASEAVSSPETKRGEKSATEKGAASISEKEFESRRYEYIRMFKDKELDVTDSSPVWGVRGFKTKDGRIELKTEYGKFYGGGISDENTKVIVDGKTVWQSGMGKGDLTQGRREFARYFEPDGDKYIYGNGVPFGVHETMFRVAFSGKGENAPRKNTITVVKGGYSFAKGLERAKARESKPEITKAEQDAAWRSDVGLPEEAKPIADKAEKTDNPATAIVPKNADFDILDDPRLGLREPPKGMDTSPDVFKPDGSVDQEKSGLPPGTHTVSIGKGANGNRPATYAFTPDGRVYDDGNRTMTHGGLSPWVLRYVTKWYKPSATAKSEKPVSPATMTPEALGTRGADSSIATYLGEQGAKRDAEIEALPDSLSDMDRQDAVDENNAKYEFEHDIIVQKAIVEHSPVSVKLADSTGYAAYLKKLGYVKRKDMLVFKGRPKSKNAAENAIAPDEVRFSEGERKRDEDYLRAVEKGDTAAAQRMVDEAAKKAGYTQPALHGTPTGGFTEFKPDSDGAIYFSNNEWIARQYTWHRGLARTPSNDGKVLSVMLNLGRTRKIDAFGKRHDNIPFPGVEWKPKVFGNLPPNAVRVADAVKRSFDAGYDSVVIKDVVDTADLDDKTKSTVYVVKSPSQIKSADPITRDDAGRIIPPSERFNPKNDDIRFSESDDSPSPAIDTPDEDAVKMRDRAVNKWVEKDIGANPKWQYAQGAKEGHAQRFEKLWGKYKDIEKTIRATHNPDEVSKEDAPAFRFHLMRMWGDWNVANADKGYDPTTHEVADWAKKQARDFADYALSVGEEQKRIGRSISFIERWQRDAHTKVGMAVQLADVYEKMFRTAVGDEKYNEARQVSKDVMDALKKQLDASTAQADALLKDSNILTASLRKLTFMRKTKVRSDADGQAKYLKQLKMPSGLKLSEGEGASHDDILTALQIKALEAGGELSEADVTDFLKKNGIEGTHENAPVVLLAETYDSIYRGMQAEAEGKPVRTRPARAGGDIVQQINDRTAAVYGDITDAIQEDIIKKAIKEGRNRAGIANELMKAGIPREQANFFSEQISVAAELSRKTALESLKARYQKDAPEKARVRLNALERIMQAFRVADLATADKATDATDSPWSEVRQVIDSAFGFKKPIDKKFLDDAVAMHNEYLTFDAQGNHVGAADSYDKLMWHMASRYGSDGRSAFKSYIGANVLSGINTTVRNVVSTASRTFDSLVVLATKQMTEGISEVARGDAAKGWAKMSAALVPFHIMFKAAPRGFGQALNMLKHGINPSEYRIGTDDEKIMGDPKVVNALEYHPAFQGKFNPLRAMKLVFRSLRAQDIFFSSSLKEARYAVERINAEVEAGATAAEAKSLVMSELGYDKTGEAYRSALKLSEDAGLTGIERDINIAIEIHRNLEPEAYELANRWSRVETFNDQNPERLIGRIADFLRHSTQDNTMWWIGMFARISANVTNYLVDTSAFGLPLALKDRYIGRYKGNKNVTLTDSEFHERSIRGAYGLMWTVGVIAYAMSEYEKEKEDPAYKSNFRLNGPGPRNPTANRLWLQNNEPWTITVGGRSFKYLYIGALASPLASAATISDEAKYGELDKADNNDETQAGVMDRWLPAVILGASNFISSQLPGQTAADLMTALYSGDTQKTRMFLEAQMASIGSAVVPYSGLVRYFDRTIDPTVYTSKNRMFLYSFFRNVPVVRGMALFPKRTIFGDAATMPKNIQDVPIGERATRLMGEALTSQLEKDDDLDFLFRAQRQFTAPQYDELKIPVVKDGQTMLTDMTPAQYDEFLVEFGYALRTQVHAIRQGYTGTGLEQYVNRDNKDLAKRLSAARTAAMKMAMYKFWFNNGLSISTEKK
jgi:hypothetical protein